MDNSSQWRMAAAQHVFSIAPAQVKEHENPGPLSLPTVGPDAITLDRFWRRIAELTKRYHDSKDRWIGCHEIREWNKSNRKVGMHL
jgi:hypothetical protein